MQMNSGFHGSILHVLEYAEYFLQKKADVHIGAVFISAENRKIAEDLGIHVHSIRDVPLTENTISFLPCIFFCSPTWFSET